MVRLSVAAFILIRCKFVTLAGETGPEDIGNFFRGLCPRLQHFNRASFMLQAQLQRRSGPARAAAPSAAEPATAEEEDALMRDLFEEGSEEEGRLPGESLVLASAATSETCQVCGQSSEVVSELESQAHG